MSVDPLRGPKIPFWAGFSPGSIMAHTSAALFWDKREKAASSQVRSELLETEHKMEELSLMGRSKATNLALEVSSNLGQREALEKILSDVNWSLYSAGETADILALLQDTSLEKLDLQGAHLSSFDLGLLPATLKELRISNIRSSELEFILVKYPLLEKLYVTDCASPLSLEGISHEGLNRLFFLNCEGLSSIPSLSNFPNLRHFCLDASGVRDISSLLRHAKIESVEISNCRNLKTPPDFHILSNLQRVDIANCPIETAPRFNGCPILTEARIRQCTEIKERFIPVACPSLKTVLYIDSP